MVGVVAGTFERVKDAPPVIHYEMAAGPATVKHGSGTFGIFKAANERFEPARTL